MCTYRGNEANYKQQRYDRLRKKTFDKKRAEIGLTVGDLVLYNIGKRYVGNVKKFKPNFIGPFEIIGMYINGGVKLREIDNPTNEFNTTVDNIKPYHNPLKSPINALLSYYSNELYVLNDYLNNNEPMDNDNNGLNIECTEFINFILSDMDRDDVMIEIPLNCAFDVNDAMNIKIMNETNVRDEIDNIEAMICDIQIMRL